MTRSVVRKGWEDPPNRVLDELWGPIDTDPTSEWYMGASEGTNNTGELTGIAQALLRMKKGGGKEEAAICYDSEYAAKCTEGIYKPKKNLVLVQLCQRLYSEECERRGSKVRFIHVKGHSGDRWNDRADELVQWGKEEGPYSRLRLRRETVSESRERNATWRERLKREKEGEKREKGEGGEKGEVGSQAKITVVIGDTGMSIESSMGPNGPFVVNLSANMLRMTAGQPSVVLT